MKIIGYTVGTSLPKPNFDQNDPKKGDYIRGDRSFLKSVKTIEQDLSEVEKVQARVNLDMDYATDNEILAVMLEEDIIPVIKTETGALLCSAENTVLIL